MKEASCQVIMTQIDILLCLLSHRSTFPVNLLLEICTKIYEIYSWNTYRLCFHNVLMAVILIEKSKVLAQKLISLVTNIIYGLIYSCI